MPKVITEKTITVPPNLGSAEGVHPDVFRFIPVSFDLFLFALLVSGHVPICADLLRFDFGSNQNKSGKPLLPTPFANSRKHNDCKRFQS